MLGFTKNLWSSIQQFSLLKTQEEGSQRKFQRHAESIFVSKRQLAASFSTSTADGPNTSTLLTAWEIIEGLCHDCLRYPLYFSPPDGSRSHWAVESMRSLYSLCVCLTVLHLLRKSTSCRAACLTLALCKRQERPTVFVKISQSSFQGPIVWQHNV